MYKKLAPETVPHYINFTIKLIWDDLYLFFICIIFLGSSAKVFSITWTSPWATGSSVKLSISDLK